MWCIKIRQVLKSLHLLIAITCFFFSILDESTTPEDNIILLLKKANLDDYIPSKERLLEYR